MQRDKKKVRFIAFLMALLLVVQDYGVAYAAQIEAEENLTEKVIEEMVENVPEDIQAEETESVDQEINEEIDCEEVDFEEDIPETEIDVEQEPEEIITDVQEESNVNETESEIEIEAEPEIETEVELKTEIEAEAETVTEAEPEAVTEAEEIFEYSGTVITGLKEGVSVTELVIPEGVTEIGSNAFLENTEITTVILPDSLTFIGFSAFKGCSALTNIAIPKNVTYISNYAFENCSALSSIEIQTTGMSGLNPGIFKGCNIGNVTFSNEMTIIPNYLFSEAGFQEGLKLELPSTITSIGSYAFSGTAIGSVVLPENLQGLGEAAFKGCSLLTEITIPKNVSYINPYAFADCSALISVTIDTTELWSASQNIFSGCNISSVTFADGITRIPSYLFYAADFQEGAQLVIPATVTDIGESAFYKASLSSIILPDGLEYIRETTFRESGLTEITIPKNVYGISTQAFYNCSKLTKVNIESTKLMNAGKENFTGCNIDSVTLAEGMSCIPGNLFYKAGIVEGTKIAIPSTVTRIGWYSFYEVPITEVVLPEGLQGIEEYAFSESNLTEITIPKNVTSIGASAFQNCSALTEVKIETVNLVKHYCMSNIFKGCNINSISLAEGMPYIPHRLFHGAGIQSGTIVTIPASVTDIGDYAFAETGLSGVTFSGNNLINIGSYSFAATEIEEITLPDGLSSIEEYAFLKCSSLRKIVIPSSVTSFWLDHTIFVSCPNVVIYTPAGSKAYELAIEQGIPVVATCSIQYHLSGGTNNPENPSVYETGDEISFLDPTKKGYTFEGWYTDQNFENKIESTEGKNGNLNLYAKWKIITYNITYELNGGEVTGNPQQYDITKSIKLKDPKKTGFIFEGWYLDADDENTKITTIPQGTVGDLALTAKWKEYEYKIKFMGNGGKTAVGETELTVTRPYSAEEELPGNSFEKTGYEFVGWNTKKDGKGTTYNDREVVSKLSAKNNSVITLYAMWETEKFWITYELDGDDVTNSNPEYYTASKDVTLKNPTNPGYTFAGWYTDEAFVNKVTKISKNTAVDITLYAKWNENTYNVSFNLNGGKGTAQKLTGVKYTEVFALPDAAGITRNGYTLKGLNTKKDGKGTSYELGDISFKKDNIPAKNKATLTLYAIWEPVQYPITYELNGATENNNPDYYTVAKDVKLQTPIKPGYTFLGWYSDAGFSKKVTSIKKSTQAPVTVYAKWSEDVNVYSISYNLNGGKGTAAKVSNVRFDEVVTLPTGITRTGYIFVGWNTNKKGTGTSYTGETITSLPVKNKGSITLYAMWEAIEHQITYKNMDGVTANDNPEVYTIAKDVSLKNPVKPGYTFGGWFTDQDLKTKITKVKKSGTTDVTLYAKWTVNTYSVKFNANGGKGSATERKNLIYSDGITLPGEESFTREGYELIGWNTAKKGNGVTYLINDPALGTQGIATKNKATVTLYAMWSPIEHTITYLHESVTGDQVMAEDVTNDNPAVYTIEKNILLKSPAKAGYTFRGWYTQEGKRVILVKKTGTEDITLVGKWEANTYAIKFNANGGSGTMQKVSGCVYDTTIVLPDNTFEKEGCEFAGWNTRKDGMGVSYDSAASVENLTTSNKSVVTLYAQWRVK